MKYVLLASILLIGGAHAEGMQETITGPSAAPRVPEAATDVPIQAPGPATGSPAAAKPTTSLRPPPASTSGTASDSSDKSQVIAPATAAPTVGPH
jgi:hypothetical protein